MEAMMDQLRFGTANIGGSYDSSRRAEQAVSSARSAMAQFLNCATEESLAERCRSTKISTYINRILTGINTNHVIYNIHIYIYRYITLIIAYT